MNLAAAKPSTVFARSCRQGTGADRQLKVFEETGGDLKAVVDYMAKETGEGL